MGLGVQVDEADAFARLRERGPKVDGGGRLPDAAFLVHQSDGPHFDLRVEDESVARFRSIYNAVRKKRGAKRKLPPWRGKLSFSVLRPKLEPRPKTKFRNCGVFETRRTTKSG